MNVSERRAFFRAILAGGRCCRPASVFDPMSARCAKDVGYDLMMMAGSTASLAVMGAPDIVLITLTEFTEQCRRVVRAADLPLLVDADHGYGNALNAARAVEELELAGVAAMTIEDTALPTPFGAVDKGTLVSVEEGVGKIRAALAARSTDGIVVIARTGAVRITGLADTVLRARAYETAGAEALHVTGIRTREELDAIASATTLSLIVGVTPREMDDENYFASRRVKVALQGHKPMMIAIAAVHAAMAELRAGTHPSEIDASVPDGLISRLSEADRFAELAARYLAGGTKKP